jgi:hypothetical protein
VGTHRDLPGQPCVVHRLGHGRAIAEVRGDSGLPGGNPLSPTEHLLGACLRDEGHARGIGDHEVAIRDLYLRDRDGGPERTLPQTRAGRARDGSAGEDRETEGLRLGDVAAHPISYDPGQSPARTPQRQQAAPAGNVGASAVGDDNHVAGAGRGDGAGCDVRTRSITRVRFELDRARHARQPQAAPLGPQSTDTRRQTEAFQGITDNRRVEPRQSSHQLAHPVHQTIAPPGFYTVKV